MTRWQIGGEERAGTVLADHPAVDEDCLDPHCACQARQPVDIKLGLACLRYEALCRCVAASTLERGRLAPCQTAYQDESAQTGDMTAFRSNVAGGMKHPPVLPDFIKPIPATFVPFWDMMASGGTIR